MRCLVFGATGFLGGPVVSALTAAGHEVVGAGLSGPDEWIDLAAAGPGGAERLLRAVAPDTVLNCAGLTDGTPRQLVAADVVAVAHLLCGWAAAAPGARLVHLGSAAEYGAPAGGRPIGEDDPERPVSQYGLLKLAATELVRAAHATGRPAVVLRVFNPLGPGTPRTLLPGRLAAELCRAATDGARARVGCLDGARDFVDVRDVADAVFAASTERGPLPPVLNVGSGRATPLRELARVAADLAGVEPPEETADPGSPRSATVLWQRADVTAAGEWLGWTARRPLAESLSDMGLAVRSGSP